MIKLIINFLICTLFFSVSVSGQITKEFKTKLHSALEDGAFVDHININEGYVSIISRMLTFCYSENLKIRFKAEVSDHGEVLDPLIEVKYRAATWMFIDELDLRYIDSNGEERTFHKQLPEGERTKLYDGNTSEKITIALSEELKAYLKHWAENSDQVLQFNLKGDHGHAACMTDQAKDKAHRKIIHNWFQTLENLSDM